MTRLAGEFGIRELVTPGEPDRAPQVVVESVPEERLVSLGAHPIVRAGDGTVCRLPSLARTDGEATACGHGSCLAHGFGFLPIDPYHMRWEGDVLRCSFAALDTREIERVIGAFGHADYVVELEQLIRAGDGSPDGISAASETVLLDIDELTRRPPTSRRNSASRRRPSPSTSGWSSPNWSGRRSTRRSDGSPFSELLSGT